MDTTAPSLGAPRRARIARMLAVAWGHFAHDVFTAFYAPLLPLLRESLGLSYATAGLLQALHQAPALGNPLLGLLADRTRLRWMLVAAPSITAAGMCLIGVAPTPFALGALLLFSGIGSALWHVPAPVILARLGGRRVGLGMSLFMVAGEAARSAGPFVALALVALWGPGGLAALLPLALATSAMLFVATRGLEAPRPEHGAEQEGRRARAARLVRLFAPIALIIGARAFLVASLATYLPSFVVERGGSLLFGGAALGILQAAGAAGALASGTLSDRVGRRWVLAVVTLLAPPAMLALVHAPEALLFPLLLILGVLAFSTNPPLLALVQEHAAGRPALATGIFMTLGFCLRSGVVVLVGLLADARGMETAFTVSGLLAFLGLIGVAALPKAKTD